MCSKLQREAMMGISAFAMACCWVDQLGIWEIGSMHFCVLCVCSKNVGSWACIKMRPLDAIGALELSQYTQINRSPYRMFL
uniref:Uncharacterized protein n=1 Tax=Oryza meridionalis TaxID=40149 RepID=A0A0E0ERT8_9ORYZ